jgi:glycine/D-amino acid oxidase-like deaminating enzyme/nitrite reductase/ring-hydroxylating ferredoxin subunit
MAKQVREATTSLWMETAEVSRHQSLSTDVKADVCIVGAGIAGLTTAYQLASEGRNVVVLDDGPVAGGQTQRTSAHLSNAIDDRYIEIEKVHGEEGARLAAESHTAAIDRIEAIAETEGIQCEFLRVDGYLFLAPGHSADLLEQEREAAHRAGLIDVDFVTRAPASSFDTKRCLHFPRQGQFHPVKYLSGLADAFQSKGGKIYTNTHASQIEGGKEARVVTGGGPVVKSKAVVVATNAPVNDLVAIHTKQAPYLTYVIGARVARGALATALYWDTLDAYHYIRVQPMSQDDMLLIGGEDHKAGQVADQANRWDHLEAWARERFPMMGSVEYQWSGMVMETIDGLAFIGRNPMDKDNVYIVTGDSGMGLTHGTIAGMLLPDLISGRENPWSAIYEPTRKPVWGMAWKEFITENANVAKEMTKDWLGGGDVSSIDDIPRGEGAIMRRGVMKVAVYRDGRGTIHEHSAVCPHLGCIVHWNGAEKTWDCPCHGSRFNPKGEFIAGPANSPLSEA